MMTNHYYYTTKDIIGLGRDIVSGDITTFIETLSYTNALKSQWPDIFKLFQDYLTLDNHIVVRSYKDSMSDPCLPRNDTTFDNIELIDNPDITYFYENLMQFLFETAEEYSQKLSLYIGLASERLAKPSSEGSVVTGSSEEPVTATFDSAPSSDMLSNLTETKTSASSEATTPLDRYENAIKSARSILKEWYDDYVRRFALYE